MDDSDIMILDEPATSSVKGKSSTISTFDNVVAGIPRSFKNDDGRRFSFGVGNLSRRSLSQPMLNTVGMPGGRQERDEFESKDDDNNGPSTIMSTQAQALISPLKKKGRTKKDPTLLDEFYGVYCLISRSAQKCYKNRCYIGYTVDPNRRIQQHNGGREKGGAKKTDNRGPWDMVCIVHGFPNSVAALRFEWAWQNPEKSRVIKELNLKKKPGRKETPFAFRLRIACHLMNSRPWCRYALTFRWLLPSEELPFPIDVLPPDHVGTRYGLVEKTTSKIPQDEDQCVDRGYCRLCSKPIEKLTELTRCVSARCSVHFHLGCLAADGLKKESNAALNGQLFPLNGNCPSCGQYYIWGEIVREHRWILRLSQAQTIEKLKEKVPIAIAG